VAKQSTGQLSQLDWGDVDLQLQTEVRYEMPATMTTIFVADGVTIARVNKKWQAVADVQQEQINVREYHHRLTRAISNLGARQWIELEELTTLADRLVSASLKFTVETLTSDIMAILQGAMWSALVGKSGNLIEVTPNDTSVKEWSEMTPHLPGFISSFSVAFQAGQVEDISFKMGDEFILFVPKKSDYLIVKLEGKHLPGARRLISRIIGSTS
jgi:hypothetical protein